MAKTSISDRIILRIGRRGLVLSLLSTVYFWIGLKALFAPARDEGHFMLYAFLPPGVRAAMWLSAAVLGLYAATVRRGRNDGLGFAALCVPTTIVMASYAISFVAYLFGITNYALGWVDAIEWGAILALLNITSGWTEVDPQVTRVKLRDREDV